MNEIAFAYAHLCPTKLTDKHTFLKRVAFCSKANVANSLPEETTCPNCKAVVRKGIITYSELPSSNEKTELGNAQP